MVVLKDLHIIDLDQLNKILSIMKIEKLAIFSVSAKTLDVNCVKNTKDSNVSYVEIELKDFIKTLNNNNSFLDYNKDSLYILRDGDFLDIKNIFHSVEDCHANIGRGGSQKSHILSPLDFRLSSYLLAMFNLNYELVSSLNVFNSLSKDRYLSYMDKSYEFRSIYSKQKN
jgi:hypothetical protein